MRSVAQTLGTPDFIRVRVGVSRPPGESESKDYLLESMSAEARANLDSSIQRAAEAVEAIIADGLERAMGRFNQRLVIAPRKHRSDRAAILILLRITNPTYCQL